MTLGSWLALAVAVMLALVHVAGPAMRFLDVVPRSRWLSAAGGASVSYVFLHLLPELSATEEHVTSVYAVALAGLVAFYGLERLARRHSGRRFEEPGTRPPARNGRGAGVAVFWLHVGSFALYNLLIGYLLLHREDPTRGGLVLYATAMALHFLVNDHGLRDHHRRAYDRRGRWSLAAAVLLGWTAGVALPGRHGAAGALFAFLAGGVLLNVIKEELPAERESRYSAFLAGVAGYGLLLWLI